MLPRLNSAALRQLPGLKDHLALLRPRVRLAFSLYPPGLPLGQVVQIQGPAAWAAALRLLAEHPAEKAAWVEERRSAYPPGLAQRGAGLQRLLFVEGGAHYAWALAQLARSQVFKLIVAASPLPAAEAQLGLRRLQLAVERAGALVLLAAPAPDQAWALGLRLEAEEPAGSTLRLRPSTGAPREAVG